MKKFLIAVLIVTGFAFNASAQENVSNRAIKHLAANYSTAKDIVWTVSDKFEKASFTLDNEKTEVFYDEYGFLIGSSKTMAFDKLPKEALDMITTQYTFPDYQLTDCIEYTDADGNKTIFVSFDTYDQSIVVSVSNNGSVVLM